ncbi:hypothetical protein JCM3770_001696 [Rhodotorula araucariae]
MDESPLVFVERWTAELRALQGSLQATRGDGAVTTEDVQRLSKELTVRAGELPAFELGRCERELKALQDTVAAFKTASAPKAKFSFKRAASSSSSSASSRAATPVPRSVPPPPSTCRSPVPPAPPTALALSSLSSAYLTTASLPAPPNAGAALALSSLSSCLVDLRALAAPGSAPGPSALYLTRLRACVVLLPSRGGASALLQECEGCVIALGAHQLRMHDSTDCAVLVRAGSTPVIERCRRIRFGPYPSSPASAEPSCPPPPPGETKAEAELVDVQDFDDPFASRDRPSPHWRLLTGAERAAIARALPDADAGTDADAGGARWQAARDAALQVLQAYPPAEGQDTDGVGALASAD